MLELEKWKEEQRKLARQVYVFPFRNNKHLIIVILRFHDDYASIDEEFASDFIISALVYINMNSVGYMIFKYYNLALMPITFYVKSCTNLTTKRSS